jgi:hypothetical protein
MNKSYKRPSPPTKSKAAKRKQPPQQARRFAKQTFPIGCRSKQNESKATNYAFCSYIYADVILPNRSFNPHPKMGQVNMFNKNEIMKLEPHGKKTCCSNRFNHHVFREIYHEKQINNRCNEQPLCLTIRFHPDFAIAKRGEDGALGRRLRRGQQFYSDVINALRARTKNLISC